MLSPRFSRLVFVTLLAIIGFFGCDYQSVDRQSGDSPSHAESAANEQADLGAVDLLIDCGGFGGQQRNLNVSVPCSADSTVFSILQQARDRGDLEFDSSGSGQFVFVSSIAGIENQQESGKNWVFRINGKLADRSCGVASVQPDDKIEWTFGAYQP